jgi:hypothetical protein
MGLYHLLLWLAFAQDVRDLGAPDFALREAAEARLTRWADLAVPLLDRPFTDLEQRRRVRRIRAQVVPSGLRPLALCSGRPLSEWANPSAGYSRVGIVGKRPGHGWFLSWVHPDPQAPLARLIYCYGERTRTQAVWMDWHSASDSREASRLLAVDLCSLGVPPPLVRWWLAENE